MKTVELYKIQTGEMDTWYLTYLLKGILESKTCESVKKKKIADMNAFWFLNEFYFEESHITYIRTIKHLCLLLPEFSKAWQNICRERMSFQDNKLQVTKLRSKCPQPWTVFKEFFRRKEVSRGLNNYIIVPFLRGYLQISKVSHHSLKYNIWNKIQLGGYLFAVVGWKSVPSA